MFIGIIIVVIGLMTFMIGGALTNDDPGIERKHAIVMATGFTLIIIGGIIAVYTMMN